MSEPQWISVADQPPQPGEILVIFDNGEHGFLMWSSSDLVKRRGVRYWMPFPKPPPDPFDEWWRNHPAMESTADHRFVGYSEGESYCQPIHRLVAKTVWDAALAHRR